MLPPVGVANRMECGGVRSEANPIPDGREGRGILGRPHTLVPVLRFDQARGTRRTAEGGRKGMGQLGMVDV